MVKRTTNMWDPETVCTHTHTHTLTTRHHHETFNTNHRVCAACYIPKIVSFT